MKKQAVIFINIIITFFIGFQVNAQEVKNIEDLKSYIEASRELFEIPGIVVAVVKDGEIQMNEGFGYNNMETMEATDTESIYGIASCTKAMTAACLAMMVEDSLIQWTDRVIDHYPEFAMNDPYITREMRIQDLVSHRSGLQTFDGDLLWYGADYSRAEVVERIRYRPASYSFRSQFGYQNVMFIAAGELIHIVTGKNWDDYLSEHIFSPLGMNSSSTTNSHFKQEMKLAYPHIDGKPQEFINYDNCGPAASVNTCSDDLIKWVEAFLNKGTFGEEELFSQDQYQKLTTPMTLLGSGPGEKIGGTHFSTYGLGWFMFDYQGRKVIQHGGGLPGFHSKVVLIPEENLGYVILANELSGLVEAVYKKILDFYLPGEDKDWAAIYHESAVKREKMTLEAEQRKEEARLKDTNSSFEYNSFAGMYNDSMYGNAKIEIIDTKLHLTLLPSKGLFHSEMTHWENDTFKITFNDPFLPSGYVTFTGNENNEVTDFTIDLKNPDFHFYKLNFKKIN